MTIKPEAVLFLTCWNIFGFTRTVDEYKQKRRLMWFMVIAFLVVFFIIGLTAIIELFRASNILTDIEDLKDEIEVIRGNISKAIKRRDELKERLRQVKIDIMQVRCTRKGFTFRREEMICTKRIYELYNQQDSEKRCKELGGDGLFKLDSSSKLKMFDNFPFDGINDQHVDKPYWIDGTINDNGIWTYSNGTTIPSNLGYDYSLKSPKCFVILQVNNYKFTNELCDNKHYSLCEMIFVYEEYTSEVDDLNNLAEL